jgi:archaellum biogenesis ATPase FlaH
VERPVEKAVVEKVERKPAPVETVYGRLRKELEDLKKDSIALVSVESGDHGEAISSLMKIFISERKMNGIYISASKPYEQITRAMGQADVKANKLFFIDCISHMAGKLPEKAENAVFIENPSSLEEVGMYVDKVLVRLAEPKFIILDSLSSLLIYNSERSVEEFTHMVINKMRLEKVGGVIVSIKQKEAEALTKTLVPMCDKEIIL